MYDIKGDEIIELFEFRIHPYITNSRLFTLYIEGERPIYYSKSMIFFFSIEKASEALSYSNCGAKKIIHSIPKSPSYLYDYNSVLRVLEDQNISHVDDAMTLDCLQLMCDYCFDTMDFWTEEKKNNDAISLHVTDENSADYMIPIEPIRDIKEEYDFFRKIFSASMFFLTEKEIDLHFLEQGYKRIELIQAMKYLIGEIASSALYID